MVRFSRRTLLHGISKYVARKGGEKQFALPLRINLRAIIFTAEVFHKNFSKYCRTV
jgi:hypothetical protein